MPHKGHQENLANYSRQPCAQNTQNSEYMPYTVPLMSNNVYNQGQNVYNMVYGHQNLHRNQVSYSQNSPSIYFDHSENNWVSDARLVCDVEKNLKSTDKMDTVEITSKDLSPASFCSNLDLLLPDFHKNVNKDVQYNKMQESQWFYNTNYGHKFSEYPSCAQFNYDDGGADKTVKYCSIQKQNYLEKPHSSSSNYGYNVDLNSQIVQQCSKNDNSKFCEQTQSDYTVYNHFEKVQDINLNGTGLHPEEYYAQSQMLCSEALQFPAIQNIDQGTEVSNEESDIIVEESEEEVTDYSEDLERRLDYGSSCVVCNAIYTITNNQFYALTNSSPLTMSSQKPVYSKLTEIVGAINSKQSYICSHCLGLLNTIDHLQYKLDSCKCELFNKFNVTPGRNVSNKAAVEKTGNLNSCKKQKFKVLCEHSFKCRVCKRTCSLKECYLFHMRRHKYTNGCLCDICGRKFTNFAKLNFHLSVHKRAQSIRQKAIRINAFLCQICAKPFRTKSHLKEHENYCSGKAPYVCKYSACRKKFTTPTKLKHHTKLKHDKKFTSICSICNIGFVKLSDYKSHMVSHSTDKKFQCNKCEKSYKTLSNLNFHLKFHNEKLPFICDVCNKGFMRKDYLESHVNLHNGIKNFACQLCDKKFVSQKNLDAHLKYHDGTVKKKPCNICGKLISTGLEDHLRTHNNLREFNCENCDMKFNTRSALTKHIKRKHEIVSS